MAQDINKTPLWDDDYGEDCEYPSCQPPEPPSFKELCYFAVLGALAVYAVWTIFQGPV